MNIRKLYILFALCLYLSVISAQTAPVTRMALLIGSNEGNRERQTLLYAESDARNMAQVMNEMGGVQKNSSQLLLSPNKKQIMEAFNNFQEINEITSEVSRRTEFMFYYSGHSDETGLLLGEEHLSYPELKSLIKETGADVNIAILDSCSSGAFTRLKGGVRKSSFLMDESVNTEGHAFLTSSSENEASQESDLLGASFFTHYLISAMRGAGDTSGDGKVSLNEAYSFASSETLTRTASTRSGAQHPSYNFQLSGTGDLILTDLRVADASLTLDKNMTGRLFVSTKENKLVAEVNKLSGSAVKISLPPGFYRLTLKTEYHVMETTITLRKKSSPLVSENEFSLAEREETRSRGNEPAKAYAVDSFEAAMTMARKRFEEKMQLFSGQPTGSINMPEKNMNDYYNAPVESGTIVGLMSVEGKREGVQVSALMNVTEGMSGIQMAGIFNANEYHSDWLQIAGIFNANGGNMMGIQLSGVFNMNEGKADAFQAAGVFNINSGPSSWGQYAGVFNLNEGSFDGMQYAGIFNMNEGPATWGQFAGIFNMNEGSFSGIQFAGLFNINEGISDGIQTSGLFNANSGNTSGLQAAGLFNSVQGTMSGIQLAGGFNYADKIEGIQIGIVNIAGAMRGGLPLGLINISGDGLHNPSAWTDGKGFSHFGFQLGTPNIYSLFSVGSQWQDDIHEKYISYGYGIHFTSGFLFLEADVSAKTEWYSANEAAGTENWEEIGKVIYPSSRISLGWNLGKSFALIAGVEIEGYFDTQTPDTYLHTGKQYLYESKGNTFNYYTDWFVGIRI